MQKKVILSGIQPSGIIHLGNYLGAIKQWIELQNKYQAYFCIVDLHAITVRQNPQELKKNVRKLAALYLACGLDPKRAILFVQSHIPAHTELAWILDCHTQLGELERMTQFKDKSKRHKQNINAGLLTYPVLMAADILLYQTDLVPVGEDQKQHVELTRDIAQRFNNLYGPVFKVPKVFLPQTGARIMGLDNPQNKMSKSAGSEYNYISFEDQPEKISRKIMKAITDSGSEIKASKDKPALVNLLTIYSLLTGQTIADLEKKYQSKGYSEFKKDLAEVIIEFLQPLQKKYYALLSNHQYLDEILLTGAKSAEKVAGQTLIKVKKTIGLK